MNFLTIGGPKIILPVSSSTSISTVNFGQDTYLIVVGIFRSIPA